MAKSASAFQTKLDALNASLLLRAGVLCYLRGAVFGTVNGDHVWDICICSVPPITADSFCALTV